MTKERIEKRIAENMYRIDNANKIAVYPYGNNGRIVEEVLLENKCIVDFYIDNDEEKIKNVRNGYTLASFLEQKDKSYDTVIILTIEKMELVRSFLADLFRGGIKSQNIVILNKGAILAMNAVEYLLTTISSKTVLDIGCGVGLQGRIFEDYGSRVTGLTMSEDERYDGSCISNTINTDFLKWESAEKYDVIWCSHVLEHVRDIEGFLLKVKKHVKKGGILAISVPSSEKNILLAHIHSFNAGRILRYLIGAGFDCRNAKILVEGYNLSVILENITFIPDMCDLRIIEAEEKGYEEVERLLNYLPSSINLVSAPNNVHYFDGEIQELNWDWEKKIIL